MKYNELHEIQHTFTINQDILKLQENIGEVSGRSFKLYIWLLLVTGQTAQLLFHNN